MMDGRKRFFALILVLCLLLTVVLVPVYANAAVLKYGSRGKDVTALQTKLKRWGYYTGSVDGVFGPKTLSAVKYFQRKNGLTVDGIVGKQTAAALGMSISTASGSGGGTASSSNDLYLLAKVVYGEARGEPYKGQVAVAAVVLNRVEHSSFPNTIAGVVYQSGAFSIVADGQINLSPDQNAINAARDAMNGWDPTNGCIYYYNPAKATSKWIFSRPRVITIGSHVFCK